MRANPMRIVSLLPSATEICFALGLGDEVVGVSPECDFPRAVREKPVVSCGLLQYEGKTSGDTSRMVGDRLVSGGALYQVDESALRSSGADLILTQGLCDVCAPTLEDVEDVARRLPRTPAIESFDPHRMEDVLENVLRVGRACGIEDRASEVVAVLQERIDRGGTPQDRVFGVARSAVPRWPLGTGDGRSRGRSRRPWPDGREVPPPAARRGREGLARRRGVDALRLRSRSDAGRGTCRHRDAVVGQDPRITCRPGVDRRRLELLQPPRTAAR